MNSWLSRRQLSLREPLGEPVKFITIVTFAFIWIVLYATGASADDEPAGAEDSLSIELIKTPEADKKSLEAQHKGPSAEPYIVKKGDYIFKILRQKKFFDKKRLPDILKILKRLNPSLTNLDVIHPGQKILIPLSIESTDIPSSTSPKTEKKASKAFTEAPSPPNLSDVESTRYTVRRGDTLLNVIRDHHEIDIPRTVLYGQYMKMLKKLNPELKDIDRIKPGQMVRLPIYRPGVVRKPIERPASDTTSKVAHQPLREKNTRLWSAIRKIFSEMGEECIQSGAHFIPLSSGGQIDLKAETFPLISFHHGIRMIVDIHGMLPERLRKLIESGWDMYRVVNLADSVTLKDAVEMMFKAAGYPEFRKDPEPLRVETDMPLMVYGDVIVSMNRPSNGLLKLTAVINLAADSATPEDIKKYLRDHGVLLVEVPGHESPNRPMTSSFLTASDPRSLISQLLALAGISHRQNVQIPAYQSTKAGLRLLIDTDFLLRVLDHDSVIDLRGLQPEIISFLNDHNVRVLLLSGITDGMEIMKKVLQFAEISSNPFPENCSEGLGSAGNVQVSLQGRCFQNSGGGFVLVTPYSVPPQLKPLFSRKDITVLSISF
jgi:hypothetical protein